MSYESNYFADFSARRPEPGVDSLFATRWSPRAFKKVPVAEADLRSIMDAARWAPSCFNEQPWRFITSTPKSFGRFLDLLVEKNQAWAKNASVLGFALAERKFAYNGKPNAYHKYDTGAAWMSLTLQARILGLYTHGMAGIRHDDVYREFNLNPEEVEVICGFAIGVLEDAEAMSSEQREREIPNSRKNLDEIWWPIV